MNYNNTKKPKTQKEQVDLIWDFLFNHLVHKIKFIDLKIGFILAFLTLMLALLSVLIFRG